MDESPDGRSSLPPSNAAHYDLAFIGMETDINKFIKKFIRTPIDLDKWNFRVKFVKYHKLYLSLFIGRIRRYIHQGDYNKLKEEISRLKQFDNSSHSLENIIKS